MGAVLLELWQGEAFANTLGFRRIPRFFGIVDIFEPFSKLDFSGILAPFFPSPNNISAQPLQDSGRAIGELTTTFANALFYQGPREPGFFDVVIRVFLYDVVVFVVPVIVLGFLLRPLVTFVLTRLPKWSLILLHLVILTAIILLWGDDGGTRELVLIFMGINIILTVSLNLVNGYMGEFSVGHAAFMAVGAYVSSVITMWAFVDDRVFGAPVLDPSWGLPVGFAIALFAGGIAAAIAALLVAFPSFRTRGDYLAIVTLAVNFIVQSAINNMEGIGGARGLNGVPLWSDLSWVLVITILSVFVIHSLVNSTFGKGIIAIREDEIASELMGVNTKHIKLVAFLVSSFFAGVAGGLFAHVLAYINPGNFGILKSTEVLVMVYLGGMGSISGSILAAVIFTLLLEALRPLAILKWVVIPLILIILMIFRPQGLFGFREIELNWGWPKAKTDPEVSNVPDRD
ncbi:MAG: branched-chain amino acid ABC transporter permease [Anaerolineae bacterium]|nr:branched-chain amino acid ABC transporter permease [Anaerolineae bacterium]